MTLKELFIDVADAAGFDVTPYSGRGMYGKQCAAIILNDDNMVPLFNLGLLMAEAIEDVVEDDKQKASLQRALGSHRTDSMGTGTVIYWPSIKWESEDSR